MRDRLLGRQRRIAAADKSKHAGRHRCRERGGDRGAVVEIPIDRAEPDRGADIDLFAPRVKVPVMMLNGRFDFFLPTDTSQEPMFRALGTPAEHKRRVVYDVSHTIPRNEQIKEFVGWMDKYWGPSSPR